MFTGLFLPCQLNYDIADAKPLCVVLFLFGGIFSIIFAKKERYIGVFFTYVIFMAALSAFGTEKFFNIDYKFGQDDLIKFAQYAKENDKDLTCYKFSHKYSLIYYGGKQVVYGKDFDIGDLKEALAKNNNLVILPEKKIDKDVEALNYRVIDKGRKHILVEGNK